MQPFLSLCLLVFEKIKKENAAASVVPTIPGVIHFAGKLIIECPRLPKPTYHVVTVTNSVAL